MRETYQHQPLGPDNNGRKAKKQTRHTNHRRERETTTAERHRSSRGTPAIDNMEKHRRLKHQEGRQPLLSPVLSQETEQIEKAKIHCCYRTTYWKMGDTDCGCLEKDVVHSPYKHMGKHMHQSSKQEWKLCRQQES
ncbi:uncharacterized protein V6R79_024069 [Siganus canaliculatus]